MKEKITDLAILGGAPAFEEKLHVGCPNIGNRDRLLTRINDLLDRKWLTNNGPYVKEIEQKIAEMLDVKHCIAMCNGTAALEITIKASGLAGEVIVPSFTFIATAHALQWHGITPIFCDIEPQTHNIDPQQAEQMITPYTTGIIGVHLWGRPCNVEFLTEIAQHHNIKLFFDAAHAFGCSYKRKMVGNFGNAEVLSFHATKFFNTFEGGAVVTNDDELANKLQLMRNFGFTDYDKVISIGVNGKMNEVSAAMGLTSLESMEKFIEVNHRNYIKYQQQLKNIPGVSMLTYDESEKSNYQYIVLEIDDTVAHVSRDQLQEILWAENVMARRYFYPGCHRMEPYRSCYPSLGLLLPNTDRLCQQVMLLPTGTAVSVAEITEICQIIDFVVMHNAEVQRRLGY